MVSSIPLLLLMVLAGTIATSVAGNVREADEERSGNLTSDSPREYNWPGATTIECTGSTTTQTPNVEVILISSNATYKTVRHRSGRHGWINLETSELVLRRKQPYGFENLILTEGANINLLWGSRLLAHVSSNDRQLVFLRDRSRLQLRNSVMRSQDKSHFYVGEHGVASFGGVVVEMGKSSSLNLVSRSIDWTCGNRRERYEGEKCTFIVGDNRSLASQYKSSGSQLRGRGYSLKLEPAEKVKLNEDFYLAKSTLVKGSPYHDRDSQDFFYVAENVLMHFETSAVTILDGISIFAISPKGNGEDHEFKILESILELKKDTVDETSSRYCGILPTAGTLEGQRAKLSIEEDVKIYLDFFVCGSDLSEVLKSPYLSGSDERQKGRVREYAGGLQVMSMKLLAENEAEFQKLVAKMEPCGKKATLGVNG